MGFVPAAVSSTALGFSLGVDVHLLGTTTLYAFYPALVVGAGLSSSLGQFSIGAPRSVVDYGYLPANTLGSASLEGFVFGLAFGSVFAAAYLTNPNLIPYGVRWDGSFVETKVGASYHRINEFGNNIDVVALAFRHQIAAISSFYTMALFGSFEYATDGVNEVRSYNAGLEGGGDNWNAGVKLSGGDTFIGDSVVTAYGDYALSDNWALDAFAIWSTSFGGDPIVGAGVTFKPTDTVFVDANVSGTLGGSNPLLELSIGTNF